MGSKNAELVKRSDENTEEYLWRIGQLIDSGKYANWDVVTPTINEQLELPKDKWRTESAFRKQYQSGKRFYNNVFAKQKGNEYLADLKEQEETLYKERRKLSTTRLEYGRYYTQEARRELFYENIAEQIPLTTVDIPADVEPREANSKEYVLTISDIHLGAEFRSLNNEYNVEECTRRFAILRERTLDFIKDNNLTHLTIINLGDDVQGLLRLSDIQLNQQPVVKSVVDVATLISRFLNDISQACRVTYYHVPYANHTQTRPFGTKANALSAEDVTYIISNYILTAVSENDRVEVKLAPENQDYLSFQIFNFNVLAAHGHNVKNIERYQRDISFMTRTHYDFAIFGHYHTGKSIVVGEGLFHDCETIIAPSFIGSDPYSDSLAVGSRPASMIYGFDLFEGHTESYKIILN